MDCFKVIPRELLSLFTADEFSLLMNGVTKIDVNDWKENTEVSNIYKPSITGGLDPGGVQCYTRHPTNTCKYKISQISTIDDITFFISDAPV